MNKEELGKLYPINIIKYNEKWPKLFLKEKELLKSLLSEEVVLRIEHIGSTAVPGLASKPTIDLLVEIPNDKELHNKIIDIMSKNNYIYMKEQKKHLMFVKGYTHTGLGEESYHIHMVTKEQTSMWDRVYFKDYLCLNPHIANQYEELKYKLSKKYKHDREAYTEGKADFIKRITLEAIADLK